MKLRSSRAFLFLLLAALLAGCAGRSAPTSVSSPEAAYPLISPPAAKPTQAALTEETAYPVTAEPAQNTPAQPTATEKGTAPSATQTVARIPDNGPKFDGERAYADVQAQMAFGPRTPGSPAHAQTINWMQKELASAGWEVEVQDVTYKNQPVKNVIAKRGTDKGPWIIIGAHFDSRIKADQDKTNPNDPVPAANDGASGVAVMLELARVLPKDLDKQVWLLFIDSEDQGELPGWEWTLGSEAFVDSLQGKPDSVVIIDMIGDANLNIYKERNSNPELTDEIWNIAAGRGHSDVFIPTPKYSMLDDHTPFLQKGIRAIDIIDFDYPYWHTTQDTADKVSAASLYAVGDTLVYWLIGGQP